ncbi:transposase [Arcicella rosea]|uniref:transposase n=1 Tax=Arcicella rosea TaxID=502909 RepID=UPI00160BCBFA
MCFKEGRLLWIKLHLLVTTHGISTHYVLAPSAHHDVVLGSEVLESYRNNTLTLFDKGYVGLEKINQT